MKDIGKLLRKLPPLIALLLLIGLLYLGFSEKPIAVEIIRVKRAPLTATVVEEAKTRVQNRYLITPPVGGYLQRIPLRAGSKVQAGETILATIEAAPPSFLDSRAEEEAKAEEKAALAKLKQMEAELEMRKVEFDVAKKEFERIDALRKKEFVSAQKWDDSLAKMQVAKEAAASAAFSLESAAYSHKRALAALIEIGSRRGERASLNLTSPVDGYLLKVFEENARVVSAGTPLLEIGDLNDLEVEVELLSSDALQVQPGAEVSLKKWGGEKPLRGRVTLVEPHGFTKVSSLGVEEQRVKVIIDFADPIPKELQLGDGYRLEAKIVTWKGDDILQIPTGALFRKGNDWMVFAAEEGRAKERKVSIGHDNALQAEVLSGLKSGEEVVLYPPDSLTDGAAITPL